MLNDVFDADGTISENQVNRIVDCYMANAEAGNKHNNSDPFWFRTEQAFLTAMIYYVLENDDIPNEEKTFATVLQKVQMETSEYKTLSPLKNELYDWFVKTGLMMYSETDSSETEKYKNIYNKETGVQYMTKRYYDTFLIAPEKTIRTVLDTTMADLQKFL